MRRVETRLAARSTADVTSANAHDPPSANHAVAKYENTIPPLLMPPSRTSFLKFYGGSLGVGMQLKTHHDPR